jgi:hypothetical protein
MSQPWPPPPDLDSIKELFRDADVEGLIKIHGAPLDEYDTEAEALHAKIAILPTSELTVSNLLLILTPIWRRSFIDDDTELALRQPALTTLAETIARFFGPEAQPQVRSKS